MFTEDQLQKYADVLLWGMRTARSGVFEKHDVVCIRYHPAGLRLAEILYAKLMDMGMNPVQRMVSTPEMEKAFYSRSDDAQLKYVPAGEPDFFKHLNGNIFLHAPASITHLATIDPQKIGDAAVARKYLRDILTDREETGALGWTLCSLTTKALAHHAKLSQKEYTRQIVNACFLDKVSPVDEWKNVFDNAVAIKQWLNSMKVAYFHVESASIDLKITPGEKRKWIGISGHNIPSFELFISPDWRGSEGIFHADQPSYRSGNYVEGVVLEFKQGRAVTIKAEKGESFTRKQLAMDEGADKIGEFSLTDRRFSNITRFMANTLYDENFGGRFGNCHIAMGSAYSDAYQGPPSELTKEKKAALGFNDSALHWDLVNTEDKRVTAHLADGNRTVIYENGQFRY